MPESQPEGEAAAGRETATAEAAVAGAGEEVRVEEGSIETEQVDAATAAGAIAQRPYMVVDD